MKHKDREYYRTISIISTHINKYVDYDIIGKEIIVVYDDIIPDLFINIPINKDVRERYDLSKKIEKVMYDVYADRIKTVEILFPNGERECFKVDYIVEHKDNKFYCCEWQVPIIKIHFYDIVIDISLLELIDKGAKVYIKEYSI